MKKSDSITRQMPLYQRADSKKEQFRGWVEEKKVALKEKGGWYMLKDHLATSAGIITGSLPIYAILEMGFANMNPLQSLYTRLSTAEAGLLGLNLVYTWGREAAYIQWNVNEKSSGTRKKMADTTYQGLFSLIAFPLLTTAGRMISNSPVEYDLIAQETFIVALTGLAAGPFVGMGMDAYRELCGTHFSSRIPQKIRNWPKTAKVSLALLTTALSLYSTRVIYEQFSEQPKEPNRQEHTLNLADVRGRKSELENLEFIQI